MRSVLQADGQPDLRGEMLSMPVNRAPARPRYVAPECVAARKTNNGRGDTLPHDTSGLSTSQAGFVHRDRGEENVQTPSLFSRRVVGDPGSSYALQEDRTLVGGRLHGRVQVLGLDAPGSRSKEAVGLADDVHR